MLNAMVYLVLNGEHMNICCWCHGQIDIQFRPIQNKLANLAIVVKLTHLYLEIGKVLLNTKNRFCLMLNAMVYVVLNGKWGTYVTGDPCPD